MALLPFLDEDFPPNIFYISATSCEDVMQDQRIIYRLFLKGMYPFQNNLSMVGFTDRFGLEFERQMLNVYGWGLKSFEEGWDLCYLYKRMRRMIGK
jgi:hypothetical protein